MGRVTYSPAYTIVPTYECFNRCSYCNFRVEPGADRWLTAAAVRPLLTKLVDRGVVELLILSGEVHPASSRRGAWLANIEAIAAAALSLGLLPHTNAGPLSREEMMRLQAVNVSMGLMLEQVTPALLTTVHRHAPSKRPEIRLGQLVQAGELGIPFTTGLLLGLGETMADRRESLAAIAAIQGQYGHIQEVILQPYRPARSPQPDDRTVTSHQADPSDPLTDRSSESEGFDRDFEADLVATVAIAREILPDDVAIQVPPNLIDQPAALLACLAAGARDLGGIGPRDEVNPDYDHPDLQGLANCLTQAGWALEPRLPVYPQYIDRLNPDLRRAIESRKPILMAGSRCGTNSLI